MRNEQYPLDQDERNRIAEQLRLLQLKRGELKSELSAIEDQLKTIRKHEQFNDTHLNRQQDILQRIESRIAKIDQEIKTLQPQPPQARSSMSNSELLTVSLKAMEGFLRLPQLQELEKEKGLLQKQRDDHQRKMKSFRQNLVTLKEEKDQLNSVKQNLQSSLQKLKTNYTLIMDNLRD